ncbi:MAG: restriction endonuclease [Candidatus Eisenbacteria bacterium]
MANYEDYELLAREIYEALLHADGLADVRVQHNVKLKGRSGCSHQVDVFWEFKMAGIAHRIALECKDFSSSVPIGRVRDFFGVVHDIGDIKGVMVTQVGFQSGAIKFASCYGIELRELRFPVEKDWEGRVKNIVLEMTAFSVIVAQRIPIADQEWVRANLNLPDMGEERRTLAGYENEILIVDSSGQRLSDFYELKSKLPHNWAVGEGFEHTFDLGDDAFLPMPGLGPVKITGVKFVYDVLSTTEKVVSPGEAIAKAILRDVKTGRIQFFDNAGNVREVRNPDEDE